MQRIYYRPPEGSAQLAGAAPGLQIRCGALETSRVGSIPMHFRQSTACQPKPTHPEQPNSTFSYSTLLVHTTFSKLSNCNHRNIYHMFPMKTT